MVDNLNSHLNKLVSEACLHPPQSIERQKGVDRLIRAIQASKKLWRETTPYYEDALQKTWFYLCRNLCEAVTAKNPYDPEKGSVITWLTNYLKHRLKDFKLQEIEKRKNTEPKRIDNEGNPIDPVDNIPAPPHVTPIEEEIRQWLEADPPTGKLNSIRVKGYPEVTIKALIERRCLLDLEWKAIAEEFGIEKVTTLRSFYNRQCKPRLREFGQQQE
ncbi:MAG: sigma-70 family RNA polymerase sigma factor [Moorea sp. SIO4G2]|nr:sigma-70 family RNA polymerase sigma factor [Moorena sp. SIO4G2]